MELGLLSAEGDDDGGVQCHRVEEEDAVVRREEVEPRDLEGSDAGSVVGRAEAGVGWEAFTFSKYVFLKRRVITSGGSPIFVSCCSSARKLAYAVMIR